MLLIQKQQLKRNVGELSVPEIKFGIQGINAQ